MMTFFGRHVPSWRCCRGGLFPGQDSSSENHARLSLGGGGGGDFNIVSSLEALSLEILFRSFLTPMAHHQYCGALGCHDGGVLCGDERISLLSHPLPPQLLPVCTSGSPQVSVEYCLVLSKFSGVFATPRWPNGNWSRLAEAGSMLGSSPRWIDVVISARRFIHPPELFIQSAGVFASWVAQYVVRRVLMSQSY